MSEHTQPLWDRMLEVVAATQSSLFSFLGQTLAMFNIGRRPYTVELTVANGATTSGAVDVRWAAGFILQVPADWDGGNITYEVAPSGADGAFQGLYDPDTDTAHTIDVTAGRSYSVHPEVFATQRIRFIAAAAVGDDRTLILMAKS